MRKEIYGIILFFLVIFTLISLLSFSPADPSINNARAAGQINNLFGIFGAHVSGMLIGLFGLGAFWIPIMLLLASIHFFGNHPNKAMISTLAGGIILVVITGALLSLRQNHIVLFGNKFSAGGIVGIPLKAFLVKYTNFAGSAIILMLLWIIGFILATGFSLIAFGKRIWQWMNIINDRMATFFLKRKERREKAKKRVRVDTEKIAKRAKKIRIKTQPPKPIKAVPPAKQEVFDFMRSGKGYQVPPFSFLN
ncbi:MAG: DNA translocase FtsK 4TM domain-containing protein, partial [Proteobacteria bacterium]|nr:DNA translocase FtsK 4TM domain-containing protein [Pseudomonadota bacterium]